VKLPEGVGKVRAKGRTYYYWNPGRKTDREGERVRLHGDPSAPANSPEFRRFWTELANAAACAVNYPAGSVGDLIECYRGTEDGRRPPSAEWAKLSESSKSSYSVHLNRFAKPEAWGMLGANELTPAAVLAGRDALKDTPGMANHMLSVGRTLYSWAIPIGLARSNPFEPIAPFDTEDRGHVPWPYWVVEYVRDHASPDLVRMERLGIATCQRVSDLIRLGPIHRERTGIWCRPKKTRRRRRATFIPLATVDALELDRWAETPITFTNTRWRAPIDRFRDDRYLYSPRGVPYTDTSLRARWMRWLRKTPQGKELCKKWQNWLTEMVAKYDWDIDPEDAKNPTIHGLRGTGILTRYAQGYDVDQIANDVGMSRQMVEHYMRFKDQMQVAAAGRRRLQLVED
jgi:integrase